MASGPSKSATASTRTVIAFWWHFQPTRHLNSKHSTNLLPWMKTIFLIVSLAIFFAAFLVFFCFVALWYLVRLHRITESVRCRGGERFNNVVDRIDKLLDYVFIRVAHGGLQISDQQTNDFCRQGQNVTA